MTKSDILYDQFFYAWPDTGWPDFNPILWPKSLNFMHQNNLSISELDFSWIVIGLDSLQEQVYWQENPTTWWPEDSGLK